MLYSESDLEASLNKINVINFHEEKEVQGIKFWCYHAGHVLGAAMFMIQIAGVKVRGWESVGVGREKEGECGSVKVRGKEREKGG